MIGLPLVTTRIDMLTNPIAELGTGVVGVVVVKAGAGAVTMELSTLPPALVIRTQ